MARTEVVAVRMESDDYYLISELAKLTRVSRSKIMLNLIHSNENNIKTMIESLRNAKNVNINSKFYVDLNNHANKLLLKYKQKDLL